ncbi:UDP-glucose/GDP-mannose dehydrogenase family protein [Candidatus Sumerlaeota bacterium]|nr:UDP-glucose/GDP-mannose dehydrogenase family protein [Candidatus Sumerlaeota bacterium]
MRLTIIGTGYVGLVTGVCFAEMGNDVKCIDIDPNRVAMINQGESPIYEPGLQELLQRNVEDGRLVCTGDYDEGVRYGEVIFICVGTPPGDDGSTDMTQVLAAAQAISERMDSYKLIVMKSTVPVGTCRMLKEQIARQTGCGFDVASNPEFLKEGTAVEDFFKPDRIIAGSDSSRALDMLEALYQPFLRTGKPFIRMSAESSELTKHASNAMLAVRISFINEIAGLCEKVGADVREVRRGMASDRRIGSTFLFPGLGFGGSCFPKDARSLADVGQKNGHPMLITSAACQVNQAARERFLQRIIERFEAELNGKTLAFWGLAFKPGTDDIREAPAIWLIQQLLDRFPQIRIAAHDPVAMKTAARALNHDERVKFSCRNYEILDGAAALIVCTEWNEFRSPDFERIKAMLSEPVIFDGRNLYDPKMMSEHGIQYHSVGRAACQLEQTEASV